uniref:Uncharacterized protein n=1 Tax=Myoviridae sp. ctZzC3 TaxID=2825130 RepID=A0A8S5Q0T0_9CAUD|nr:MAG TPA: hypothetical protein [Myoviridae sp. ctZzC3]DAL37922.1 MAG TPA_asm: hypothetical protein [Caudoviricetes sp.]
MSAFDSNLLVTYIPHLGNQWITFSGMSPAPQEAS